MALTCDCRGGDPFEQPRLVDLPHTPSCRQAGNGKYRFAIDRNLRRAFTISRVDLARSVLELLNDLTTTQKQVLVAK